MDYSPEFWKGVQKNWRTPREREQLGEAMRRKDAMLDQRERESRQTQEDQHRDIREHMAEGLEEKLHPFWKKGEIRGGPSKHLLLLSRS